MRAEEQIKAKLDHLSDDLRRQESLVPAVMARIEDEVAPASAVVATLVFTPALRFH